LSTTAQKDLISLFLQKSLEVRLVQQRSPKEEYLGIAGFKVSVVAKLLMNVFIRSEDPGSWG